MKLTGQKSGAEAAVLLRRNIVANYLGQAWTGVVGLAFVPVYIRCIGMESYGIIGLFAVLQLWVTLLDFGMSPTINREIARSSTGERDADSIRDLLRTFELACAGSAALVLSVLVAASDWIAQAWFKAEAIPLATISQAVAVMGSVAALRLLEGLYRGVFQGLQLQAWLSAFGAIAATIRAVGAVLVLILIEPSLYAFAWWQLFVSAATLLTLRACARGRLPRGTRSAQFSVGHLSDAWRFTAGVFAATMLSLAITQGDKLLLSGILELEQYGNYMLAVAVAGVLFQAVGPISSAFYPQLAALAAMGDERKLSERYHQGAQLMTVLLVPAGAVLILYAQPLLLAWTGDSGLARNVAGIVAVISIGTILNGWMHMPYMLQLAAGWSSLAAWINLALAVILIPAILLIVPGFGPIGAAWVWVAINLVHVLVGVQLMHRRVLRGEMHRWCVDDILLPSVCATLVVLISRVIFPSISSPVLVFFWCIGVGCAAILGAIAGSSLYRGELQDFAARCWRGWTK